ncbi:MAG: peptidase M20 [Robiginitomaculum sp.]|nr:MAG: peptidase M20 [Robiginitomaculum sp.]
MKKTALFCALLLGACTPDTQLQSTPPTEITSASFTYDEKRTIALVKALASDEFQGRATGTTGGKAAREHLKSEIKARKVFSDLKEQSFAFQNRKKEALHGVNLIGDIVGKTPGKGPLLIITAHYDHLGMHKGKTYNGADDNASGTAAILAIAESFKTNPPKYDVKFVWLDAEERGLKGSDYFVKTAQNFQNRPILNFNLDMVSQNNKGELFMSGAYHTPALKPILEQAANGTGITLKFGHDLPKTGIEDWTLQSDHAAFHKRGIPFVYFGVEDHEHYHKPSDTFDTLPLAFFKRSLSTIVNAAHLLDENLEGLAKPAHKND